MRHDHSNCQRNKTIERTVGMSVVGDRKVGEKGLDKI